MNFKKLDESIIFKFKDEKLRVPKKLGFTYISECTYDLYYNQGKSVQEIADIFNIVRTSVFHWTKKWGWKLRPLGGNNRNPLLKDPKYVNKIRNTKDTKRSSTQMAKKFKCSPVTVRKIWKGLY